MYFNNTRRIVGNVVYTVTTAVKPGTPSSGSLCNRRGASFRNNRVCLDDFVWNVLGQVPSRK